MRNGVVMYSGYMDPHVSVVDEFSAAVHEGVESEGVWYRKSCARQTELSAAKRCLELWLVAGPGVW